MNDNNLTLAEKELLKKLNLRAMKIVQIEETLKEIKLPIDRDYLYLVEEEVLDNILEMLSNAVKNREAYVETKEKK